MYASPSKSARSTRSLVATLVALVTTGVLLLGTATSSSAIAIRDNYYHNYFKTEATCRARGNVEKQLYPDIIMFWCYRNAGEPKWSMRVALDDGLGCSPAPLLTVRSASSEHVLATAEGVVAPACGS